MSVTRPSTLAGPMFRHLNPAIDAASISDADVGDAACACAAIGAARAAAPRGASRSHRDRCIVLRGGGKRGTERDGWPAVLLLVLSNKLRLQVEIRCERPESVGPAGPELPGPRLAVRQAAPTVSADRSSLFRTAIASASPVKGFSTSATPISATPWCSIVSSVYPDMNSTRSHG